MIHDKTSKSPCYAQTHEPSKINKRACILKIQLKCIYNILVICTRYKASVTNRLMDQTRGQTDREREKKRPSPPKAPLPPQRHDKSVLTRWTVGRAVGAGVLGARRCVAALGPPGQGPRAAAPV